MYIERTDASVDMFFFTNGIIEITSEDFYDAPDIVKFPCVLVAVSALLMMIFSFLFLLIVPLKEHAFELIICKSS